MYFSMICNPVFINFIIFQARVRRNSSHIIKFAVYLQCEKERIEKAQNQSVQEEIIMNASVRKIMTSSLILALACPLLTSCSKKEDKPADTAADPKIENYPIQHESEFGGVYIESTIDDFNRLGFTYGDSVDVVFSNGYKLEDIPYYNGYYVAAGEPLLIAYPGYDYIKAAINYGDDLWDKAMLQAINPMHTLWKKLELEDHDTASVFLREKGKYAEIQESSDIHYYDERERYPSDEVFANFRNFRMGNIKENILYRSASPCDNQHNRAGYVDDLIEAAGVQCILNLSDNDVKIEKYIAKDDFDSPYFLSLYEAGNVIPSALNMNYLSEEFAMKIAQGFADMAEKDGPYLIHCTEGKDRTGFVCMIIEALGGAGYQEIVDDYMLTYDNYYEINETKEPTKYKTIKERNIDAMLQFIAGDDNTDITTADLSVFAKQYLLNAGMSEEQLEKLIARICD